MNKHQRRADSDMRYLGAAWRAGFTGPRRDPASTSIWQQIKQQIRVLPRIYDEERVFELHGRWLRVADRDKHSAVVLLWYYRDRIEVEDKFVLRALDLFRWA